MALRNLLCAFRDARGPGLRQPVPAPLRGRAAPCHLRAERAGGYPAPVLGSKAEESVDSASYVACVLDTADTSPLQRAVVAPWVRSASETEPPPLRWHLLLHNSRASNLQSILFYRRRAWWNVG